MSDKYEPEWILRILVLAVIVIILSLGVLSQCHAAGICWSEPHSVSDKYTRRMAGHEGSTCWHPSTKTVQKAYQRASYGHGGPSYEQSSDAAYKLLTKPQLRPDVMRSINDFLLMHKLNYDPLLKDYLIRKMIERQERNIEP
jgi:hypothetical protein